MAGSGNAHLRSAEESLLRVEELVVEFPVGRTGAKVHAVSNVSFDVRPGETLGLVGESGCGKSTTGKAVMRINQPTGGSVRFDGAEMTEMGSDELRRVRPKMQMIFQDPISSLNPRRRIRDIVGEPLKIWASEHNPPNATVRALQRLLAAIGWIGIGGLALFLAFWLINGFVPYMLNSDFGVARPAYESFLDNVGMLFVGGLLGGVALLLARAARDRVAQGELGAVGFGAGMAVTAFVLLGAVGGLLRTVAALVAGGLGFLVARAVRERMPQDQWGTIGYAVATAVLALPGIGAGFSTLAALGEAVAVQTSVDESAFDVPPEAAERTASDGTTKITSDIELDGSTYTVDVAVNGTSVKATEHSLSGTGQAVLLVTTWGAVALSGAVIVVLLLPGSAADFRRMAEIRREHDQIVRRALSDVGLDPDTALDRRPHQFSGGQCQRICIARSLVLDPKVIICDEPVSALDVSVQAQILNLLEDMKARYDLTMVFIAHDLAVVKNISDRVAVMYLGKMCEVAPPDELYANPAHPYTAALLSSIPVPDPDVAVRDESVLGGEIPSPVAPPSGCRFRTRCPKAQDRCAQVEPKMAQVDLGHYVACHFPLESTGKKPAAARLAGHERA